MSSTNQSNEFSDINSSVQGYTSSAEERVAGLQPKVASPVRTVHVSTPFALSLIRRLAELEAIKDRKNPITEDEAADILVSMRKTTRRADDDTSGSSTTSTSNGTQLLGGLSRSTSYSASTPPTNEEEPVKFTLRRKETARPKRWRVIVSRRNSSTCAVFVAKTKITPKKEKRVTAYNTFRTKASKLLGTQIIKNCRKGTTFNSNVSTLWKEASEEDRAAFGDWSEADQKEYLIQLVTGPQAEKKKTVSTMQKKKAVKVATRVQPKRGVEGKAKK